MKCRVPTPFVDPGSTCVLVPAVRWKPRFAGATAVSLVALLGAAAPASAQTTTWTGNTSNDWMVGSNWSGGVPAVDTVTIERTSPNQTVIGVGAAANATSGRLYVGNGQTGSLTIQNGSTLTSSNFARVGEGTGSSGTVTVTGTGSTWTINPGTRPGLIIGNYGIGRLDITNGGSVVTDAIYVGRLNTGIVNITGGGTLTTTGSTVPSILGRDAGGNATVTVSGAGSLWTIGGTDGLVVGSSGNGTLNIQDRGEVIATNGIQLGVFAGSSGVINLTGGGTLETLNLDGAGAGAKQLNFDGGILRANANADNASFITGFTGAELNLLAGGLTVDTADVEVGTDASSAFSGAGGLTVTGGGTLSLLAANTYTGTTTIDAGTTLALLGAGSVATSSKVVADGTFDISSVTPISASIQSLAGSGEVELGTKTLTLTNANDTFAGAITGTGGLTVSAGTQTLTGTSTYTGITTLNDHGNLQLRGGGKITGTNHTVLSGPSVTMTVSGTGSLLETGTLAVGSISAGNNATLNVLNGGVVRTTVSTAAAIGGPAAQTATVNVDGNGSLLDLAGNLGIGHQNAASNTVLNITNGGTVRSLNGTVGSFLTATDAVDGSSAGIAMCHVAVS